MSAVACDHSAKSAAVLPPREDGQRGALVETEPRLPRDIYAVQNAFGRKGSQFARCE